MKAAVVHEWGQEPRYLEFPEPQPREGAVVADVEASALTNLSRMVIMGKHYSSKEIQLPPSPESTVSPASMTVPASTPRRSPRTD